MQPHWRQAEPTDLPDIMQIAEQLHPDLPERMEVYAEKLRLFPPGCLVQVADGAIVGYGVCHPWKLRRIPPLDAFLHALPREADCLYVHDVAVLPAHRGRRTADFYIESMAAVARSARIGALALVSVYGTDTLWSRLGFRTAAAEAELRSKLRSYGETAKYMIRELGA